MTLIDIKKILKDSHQLIVRLWISKEKVPVGVQSIFFHGFLLDARRQVLFLS